MTKASITLTLTAIATVSTAAMLAQTVSEPTAAVITPRAAPEVLRPVRQSIGSPAYTTPRTSPPGPLDRLSTHDLRVRKCKRIVATFYDYRKRDGSLAKSNFLPHVEFFISEHERLGMGPAWYWSLVYGGANFGLRCYGKAPGCCAGPMDVKHCPRVLDPQANIRWHCREMNGFYKRGVRGIRLCYSVFLPANPRDWGGGRFKRTHLKHKRCIEAGYRAGKLP